MEIIWLIVLGSKLQLASRELMFFEVSHQLTSEEHSSWI